MNSGPSIIAEAIVAVLVPPACRDEVVGDLHERFKSPLQYTIDVLHTVPLVISSRIRRTSDPQILLIQAFALYMSFLGAAWLNGGAVIREQWGLLRFAVPVGTAMLGLIFEDTYTNPGPRSWRMVARGPLLGSLMALASQGILSIGNPDLVLPRSITFCGCAMSLLFSSGIRILFPPSAEQLSGANAPALRLTQTAGLRGDPPGMVRVLKGIPVVVAFAAIGTWIAERSVPLIAGIVMLVVILVVGHQILKRG